MIPALSDEEGGQRAAFFLRSSNTVHIVHRVFLANKVCAIWLQPSAPFS